MCGLLDKESSAGEKEAIHAARNKGRELLFYGGLDQSPKRSTTILLRKKMEIGN